MLGLALMVAFLTSTPVWILTALPRHLRVAQDQPHRLWGMLPVPVTVQSDRGGLLKLNGQPVGPDGRRLHLTRPLQIQALDSGRTDLVFRLFGLIPFRRMTVDVVPPIRLVPGGHSIGILLKSRGVLVVGETGIPVAPGTLVHPARDGGVRVGDRILLVDDKQAISEVQVQHLIEQAGRQGEPVTLTMLRGGRTLRTTVEPVRDLQTGRWRIGLYVRDGAAGVGTMTFYDPRTGWYGALGHIIADSQTGQPIAVRDGHIVRAAVVDIDKGSRGNPGEKFAQLTEQDQWIGSIDRNTRFGIFGRMARPVQNPIYPQALPIALAGQVHEGKAELLTVVDGERLERFDVEIVHLTRFPSEDGRHMVIRVTDPRLLQRTRGIVQGMSGSPIVQNGRLVGAVTHVFVNDPTRGYGVFIEWMLHEGGLLPAVSSTALGHSPGAASIAVAGAMGRTSGRGGTRGM